MIKYPNGQKAYSKPTIKKSPLLHTSTANRGMSFEADINSSIDYYKSKGRALLSKRPTPINVVKVDYSKGARIIDAYFEKQSTTDYNGIYKEKYMDFEAKESKSKTSFPLHNIPLQQIVHLEKVIEYGGIAFFLIHFVTLGETYLLKAEFICDFYRKKERMSIPLETIRKEGFLVKEAYNPRYDFLEAVDLAFFK